MFYSVDLGIKIIEMVTKKLTSVLFKIHAYLPVNSCKPGKVLQNVLLATFEAVIDYDSNQLSLKLFFAQRKH